MILREAHVVVTGASRGTGAVLVSELTRRGSRVTMIARSVAALDAMSLATGAAAFPLDLGANEPLNDAMAALERDHGNVDVLVNNAAVADVGPFVDMPEDLSRAHINTNLIAPMEMTRLLLPGMVERGRGTVVNVSSIAGEMAYRNGAAYGASKAGLNQFTFNLQRELRRTPVNVALIVLGEVDTPMLDQVRADPIMNATAKRVEKLRPLTPQEVASTIIEVIERGRRLVVLPRAARPIVSIRQIPSRIMDLVTVGIGG